MDLVRAILLALARRDKSTYLRWQAGLAAVRARGLTPTHNEAFAHHVQTELCLVDALRAADLPSGFRIDGITLPRDPVTAAKRLRDHVPAWSPDNAIETDHEQARLQYRSLAATPLNAQETAYAEMLAGLPAARRDKVIELAEHLTRH
ncbi:hypothetical protein J3R03_003129 [Actinoplanes couchii]|uniref:DUF5753 domain-containing protein n=2 Tax=Actinoplanes couchii TaxID=403638 RepID=A0ABQ3XTJ8_9ACTN|nr:hypothetical protein [Actinoplanes couchii]MDR6318933.1 hypothetical protein [Actinoplanes couchii]GID61841.1 hypothetical protein Aco03nite_102450 [Actinoplanes couchii]